VTLASTRTDAYGKPGYGWRIASVTFTSPPGLPGLRQSSINTIRVGDTSGPWVGWEFEIDGPALLMVSPPGWVAGTGVRKGTKVTVYEVARSLAAIAWEHEVVVGVDERASFPGPDYVYGEGTRAMSEAGRAALMADVAANEATIAAAVATVEAQTGIAIPVNETHPGAAFTSPLPATAPVERDEPPDEPVVPARRGPGRPRKAP
jgi:hypothetical protein